MRRLLILSLLLCLAGCPEPSSEAASVTPAGSPPVAAGGAESPEAVFEKARAAANGGDWAQYYGCLTQRAGEEMLGGIVFSGGMVAAMTSKEAQADYEGMLAGHGVEAKEGEEAEPVEDPSEAMLELARQAKDPAACLADVLSWLAKNGQDLNMALSGVQLKGVESKGEDEAVGEVEIQGDAGPEQARWAFKKLDGLWYLDGDAEAAH